VTGARFPPPPLISRPRVCQVFVRGRRVVHRCPEDGELEKRMRAYVGIGRKLAAFGPRLRRLAPSALPPPSLFLRPPVQQFERVLNCKQGPEGQSELRKSCYSWAKALGSGTSLWGPDAAQQSMHALRRQSAVLNFPAMHLRAFSTKPIGAEDLNETTCKAFAESSRRSLRKLKPNMSLTVHERLTLVRIARRFLHLKARSAILGSLVKGNLRLPTLKYLTRILARIPHSQVNAMREECVCVCVLCVNVCVCSHVRAILALLRGLVALSNVILGVWI
jgi:hypothetical protein